MRKAMTAAVAAMTLIGGIAVSSDASAQHRRHRHDHDAAGAAIAGFALGAALAGGGRAYVSPPGYYDRSHYGRRYDDRGYRRGYGRGYDRPYYHAQRCWTERYWDPYYGGVAQRVCR